MSLTALADVLFYVAVFGVARQADEGLAAHLWQLLMVAQVPVVTWFAVKWLPQTPRPALLVLVLQAVTMLSAMAPIRLLHW